MENTQAKRLLSLDAFRGFTIAGMILVNSPGSYREVYPQLRHAQWNGWTFADTIFPFFLFIMGVSMVYSLARRKEIGHVDASLDLQIVKRTIVLFGLGLFMNSYPIFHLSTLRIPGVLQRIALCYFFTSLIMRRYGPIGQAFWLFGFLASYWLMMRFVPVPWIGAGVLEPGNNFAAYVDSLFLEGHMLPQYETWDPEGLVSTIPAIGTTLFGVLCGEYLRSPVASRKKTAGMLCTGVALVMLGMVMDHWLPINKGIWTSTFSIFMAGLAFLCLALFYWLIDVKGYKRWATMFVILGMNSIAIYFLAEILDTTLRFVLHHVAGSTISLRIYLHRSFFTPLASPENASLLFAVSYVFLMFLIAWAMWKKRLFIKI
jgi:predicted acyltransferase